MNIRASDIKDTSFVVQWVEVDDPDKYFVNWRSGDGDAREAITSKTSRTITGLIPNTSYTVTVAASNRCGQGAISNSLLVKTNMTILVTLSMSLSISSTVSTNMYNPRTMATSTGT